jgi:hypothetical protein
MLIAGLSTLDRSVLCARRVSVLVIGGWRIAMSGWCYDGSGLRAPWYRTGRWVGKKKVEMGWMKGCGAKWAVGRMEVCLEEREKVPFLQLTESQTARHMEVLVDGQR